MNPSQRVVLNTVVTYGRSIIAVGLMLFSSRWVLNALGQTDFGLYSVVGSIIVFITMINVVMAGSVARYYAYALGRGNLGEVNHWFNIALLIHLGLATVLVLIGWPVGEHIIAHILTIPADRIMACLWIFRLSIFAAFISMISMPFVAMFMAMQRMVEQACWLMLQSVSVFFLAMNLGRVTGDRLIFYAAGMVIILVCVQIGQVIHAMAVFKDCRIRLRYWRDGARMREAFSFASWILVGNLGVTVRDQGAAILLNLHFGPKINAAYGIANQVAAAANMFTNAMFGALSPEMASSEGRGDRARMLYLAQCASKLGTILIMLFAIPLITEMDYVLNLWLRNPPAYAALFCQLILVTMLIDRLSAGSMLAVNAHGKIAVYQVTLGICYILTLPLAWIFLKMGAPPPSIGFAFIIIMSIITIGRTFLMRRLLAVSLRQWAREVLLPCVGTALVSVVAVSVPVLLLDPSFTRLAITTAFGMLTVVLTAWFFAFDDRERKFFRHNALKLLGKMHLLGWGG